MALALAPRIRVNGIGPGPSLPNARQTQEQFDAPGRRGAAAATAPAPEEIGRAAVAILALPAMTGPDAGAGRRAALAMGAPGARAPPPEE